MNTHKYAHFRKDLLGLREELLKEAEKVEQGEIDVVAEDMADVADRSSLETDRNFTLRLLDRDRKLLHKIDDALSRLEKGEFGMCDECGEDIGSERLKARPVATLCIACKEESEAKEKRAAL